MVEHTMDVSGWLRKQLEEASPDLLRAMVKEMAEALMSADADAVCGAGYGERSPERVNRRNGYRERDWDTRVGSIELAVPKLREGSYFPDWLLQPRRRAEQAFVSVIADAYLAGVSTRRVEKLVQQLGVERMSKSQVSRLAKSLDQIVEDFRTRPLLDSTGSPLTDSNRRPPPYYAGSRSERFHLDPVAVRSACDRALVCICPYRVCGERIHSVRGSEAAAPARHL